MEHMNHFRRLPYCHVYDAVDIRNSKHHANPGMSQQYKHRDVVFTTRKNETIHDQFTRVLLRRLWSKCGVE